jgi:hypothetical protein
MPVSGEVESPESLPLIRAPGPVSVPATESLETAASGLIYDLRGAEASSDRCYADAAVFSTEVLAEAERRAGPVLDGFSQYAGTVLSQPERSRGEYALELLTLGIALKLYAPAAQNTPRLVVLLARVLLAVRNRSQWLKPKADLARALLFRRFLPRFAVAGPQQDLHKHCLPRLLGWLRASGEFTQEAQRLRNWQAYLRTLPDNAAENCLRIAAEYFSWFENASACALGPYTKGVPPFLAGEYARRGIREDQLFCGRGMVEYHLGLVAAEIMNRVLRPSFDLTPRKAVLLPACMRGARSATCRARIVGVDLTCTGCDPNCTIHRITRRMRQLGVPVYIVPHSTGFSRWLQRWQREHGIGVVAVACLLNILAGGYEMRARGIASQCVLLDFPGCENHWRPERIPTGVNEDRLVQIVTPAGIHRTA